MTVDSASSVGCYFSVDIRPLFKLGKKIAGKQPKTLITDGAPNFNYIRPHMALKGKTPAEVAGIKVEGENKWFTLIQNAAKKR